MTALAAVVAIAAVTLLWQWATGALEGEMNEYPPPCEDCGRRSRGLDADMLCAGCADTRRLRLASVQSVERKEKA